MADGRTISDADRARARRMTINESGRTISDAVSPAMSREVARAAANRARSHLMTTNESGRTLSDADRALLMRRYMNRNDGGMAMSGRGKPVRTF